MPGHRISQTWHYNPALNAPARYRKACKYAPFIPDLLKGLPFTVGPDITGLISKAEGAIRSLNAVARPKERRFGSSSTSCQRIRSSPHPWLPPRLDGRNPLSMKR